MSKKKKECHRGWRSRKLEGEARKGRRELRMLSLLNLFNSATHSYIFLLVFIIPCQWFHSVTITIASFTRIRSGQYGVMTTNEAQQHDAKRMRQLLSAKSRERNRRQIASAVRFPSGP